MSGNLFLLVVTLFLGYVAFDYFSKKEKNGCMLLSILTLAVVFFMIFFSGGGLVEMVLALLSVLFVIGCIGLIMQIFG